MSFSNAKTASWPLAYETPAAGYGRSSPIPVDTNYINKPPLPLPRGRIIAQREVDRETRWSWFSFVAGVFLFICCPLFGFLGVAISGLAYVDHKAGEFR